MDAFKDLVPHLKDHKTMLLLGFVTGVIVLLQTFGLGFWAAFSVGMIGVYGPLVIYGAWSGKRQKAANLVALRGIQADKRALFQRFEAGMKARAQRLEEQRPKPSAWRR